MVLDPFSALGLASNIVQFVDYGCRVVSNSVEQYKSATGSSEELVHVETIAQHLRQHIERLERNHNAPEEERKLQHLAQTCRQTAIELVNLVDSLKLDPELHGTKRRIESLRKAFHRVGKGDHIQALEHRLHEYRSELTLQSISLVQYGLPNPFTFSAYKPSDQASGLQSELRDLRAGMKLMNLGRSTQVDEILKQLQNFRKSPKATFSVQELPELGIQLANAGITASQISRERAVLGSLYFQTIPIREAKISEAHAKTFRWIFEPNIVMLDGTSRRIMFSDWLQQPHDGKGIYWIAGKAGSGKSTLMKFLHKDPQTTNILQQWATPPEKLVVASHFFWHAGTTLQKSQEGLLRSLLYDILRACPELITQVCAPERWDTSRASELPVTWTRAELLETLQKLVAEGAGSTKFFFLIDGLDEYEGDYQENEGDHSELVKILATVAALPSIKICVSSRPWEVFKAEYGNVSDRHLHLQDLTRNDIELYVREKFEANNEFQLIRSADERYQGLVSNILDRAQGVFLWVFLAVRSLLKGIKSSDTMSILQSRLDELPSELENLFQRMLDGVDRVYKRKSAQTFQIALRARSPLSIMAYSLLEEEDPQIVLLPGLRPMTESDFIERKDRTCKQINAVSQGLLEVTNLSYEPCQYFSYQVDFLHRTVREFLMNYERPMSHDAGTDFDVYSFLSLALLWDYKCSPLVDRAPHHKGMRGSRLPEDIIHAAGLIEKTTKRAQNATLDELGNCLSQRGENINSNSIASPLGRYGIIIKSLVEMCFYMDLDFYVHDVVSRSPSAATDTALLGMALGKYGRFSPDRLSGLVPILLDRGADPNQQLADSTVFGEYLFKIVRCSDSDSLAEPGSGTGWSYYEQTISLLLRYGADPNSRCEACTLWGYLLPKYEFSDTRSDQVVRVRDGTFNLVQDFIGHGADPNQPFKGSTIWEQLLVELNIACVFDRYDGPQCKSYPSEYRASDIRFVELLVRAGANLDCEVKAAGAGSEGTRSALAILSSYFDRDQVRRLKGMIAQMRSRGQPNRRKQTIKEQLKRELDLKNQAACEPEPNKQKGTLYLFRKLQRK